MIGACSVAGSTAQEQANAGFSNQGPQVPECTLAQEPLQIYAYDSPKSASMEALGGSHGSLEQVTDTDSNSLFGSNRATYIGAKRRSRDRFFRAVTGMSRIMTFEITITGTLSWY